MYRVPVRGDTGEYVLATGEAAAYRLGILHDLYGPGTRRVLLEAGLRPGMRVADLGCGVGLVTALLAELVGPGGHVVGIDASGAQLAQARERLNGSGADVSFVEASATETGLTRGSFDLVYCRFLLIHLPEPERALREMFTLLKPDGILVCEDGDLTESGVEEHAARPGSVQVVQDAEAVIGRLPGRERVLPGVAANRNCVHSSPFGDSIVP